MVGTDTYTPERWHYIVEHAGWSRAWLGDLPRPCSPSASHGAMRCTVPKFFAGEEPMSALRAAAYRRAVSLVVRRRSADACGSALPADAKDRRPALHRRVQDGARTGESGNAFRVDFAVCRGPRRKRRAPCAWMRTCLRIEHGMNYRPVVTAKSSELFRAEGLLFHMPGRWD
jgi:hypothetical protein